MGQGFAGSSTAAEADRTAGSELAGPSVPVSQQARQRRAVFFLIWEAVNSQGDLVKLHAEHFLPGPGSPAVPALALGCDLDGATAARRPGGGRSRTVGVEVLELQCRLCPPLPQCSFWHRGLQYSTRRQPLHLNCTAFVHLMLLQTLAAVATFFGRALVAMVKESVRAAQYLLYNVLQWTVVAHRTQLGSRLKGGGVQDVHAPPSPSSACWPRRRRVRSRQVARVPR